MGRCVFNRGGCFILLISTFLLLLLLNDFRLFSSADLTSESDERSYGIIIDAGSTGSRLFLYSWRSRSDQELIEIEPVKDEKSKPVVKKVTPGLSTFGDKPEAAAEYIKPLLEYAVRYIPLEKQQYTPIFIFATAGMRLLPVEKQDAIMSNLHSDLPKLTTLQVLPEHIKVIDGKWEGVYSWIAVNYILDRFRIPVYDSTTTSAVEILRPSTVGMIDMGGASSQIAFELPPKADYAGDNLETVNLGCHDNDTRFLYRIYVTTFLGYGVNEGAKKYEKYIAKKLEEERNATSSEIQYVKDACLPSNMIKLGNMETGGQFVRKGSGDWDSCVSSVINVLMNGSSTQCPPALQCCFDGVVAPKVALSDLELYGFSEYWYSVEDVLSLGGPYDHDTFENKARKYCSQRWKSIQSLAKSNGYPHADEERLETQCFKSAWIHAVLHNGLRVSENKHHFKSALKIRDQEVQWALGAMIYQMRYFPLRDAQQKEWTERHSSQESSAAWTVFYVIAVAVILIVLAIVAARWMITRTSPTGIRRGPSWSYMKLSQQDLFSPSNLRTSKFPV
ncbi:CRE-MIG-23 protein [Aphelenchoides avenae]|nr:CRE-MIG-23 protein [Aphelenchus avenae]